ncbi:MAG TPA: DUF151 domain-containing protein [bacterium]|jgi:bifunctional DNase/RNase|nr:DUF151 domain-containing protein [bacterium]
MYKPVKFITEVPYLQSSTFYLFCKPLKILLPIETGCECIQTQTVPSVYNSVRRIIEGIGAKALYLKIYLYCENVFYAYLTIKNGKETFDINVGLKDGIKMAREMKIPIYVRDQILENNGIKITKDLVMKALKT